MEIKDKSIHKRQFLFLIGIVALLVAAGAYLYYHYQEKNIREQKYTDLSAIAKLKIDQFVLWRKERIADARVLSHRPVFISEIEQWLLKKTNNTLKNNLEYRLVVPQKEYGYENIFLASIEGEPLLSAEHTLHHFDPVTSENIKRAVKCDSLLFSDFYQCKLENKIHYDIQMPLKNKKNITIAVVLLRINPRDYLYPMIQSWPALSKTSETLIVRQEGDSVLFLNDLRFRTGAALTLKIPLTRKDVPAVQSVLGYEGVFEGKDYRGVEVLSDIRPVPGTAWSMVAKVDRDEIFADLRTQAIIIIVFASLLILVSGIGVMWIYHFRQRNIYRSLWQVQEEFRTTLYSIGDAVITTDRDGKVLYLNVVAEQLTGWKENDAKNKPLEEVFHIINEATRVRVQNPVALVLKEGHIVGLANHTLLISKDGKETPIADSGSPIRDDKNDIIGVVLVFRDQTKERAIQKLLEDSETKYRRLFEAARDGILILDAETGKIVDVNPFLMEMLGYPHEYFLGKNVWELGLLKDILANEQKFSELRKKEFIRYEDLPLETFDGRRMEVEFVSNVYLVNHHKVIQCNIRDITERKQMEDQLRQIQKLEGLGTLAGGIAHDFNNILGIILAYVTGINRIKEDTKKLELASNTITKAVQRGKALVQQILMFARKTEVTYGPVNVNDVVMETMTLLFETFPKTITYSQNFDKSVPYINADHSQLHQVLLNLCVNARDAMPCGGVLSINTRMVSNANLRNQHPDAPASSYVCVEVSDSGDGMTPEIQKRIFEPFFTTKGPGKGTGLGLSVVYGVIQGHKGFVDVESELGKGTTFWVYLPTSQVVEPVIEKVDGTLEEIQGGTETLLIVEDEEMLLMSLQLVLFEKGYNVLSAGDGFTALKIYHEQKNDIALVLTDFGLPSISGLELCHKIKQINPNERIILATGFLDPEMKAEFLKVGVSHFLFKPYDLRKALKVVREVLDGK
jgi:two-component system, cell cycle sensor histidine kinase and response regulator CckA